MEDLKQIEYIDRNAISIRTKAIVQILMNSLFLVIWVFVNFGVTWIIENIETKGFNVYTLTALRIIFALASLIPVLIFFYKDIKIIIIRSQREIQKEKRINEQQAA